MTGETTKDAAAPMQRRVLLFIVSCFLGGAGAFVGSVLGHAVGKAGLFAGALIGGLLGSLASALVARARRWIPPERTRRTALGAAIGFVVAALIATRTLGSPIGPVLSTALIGLGALLGAGRDATISSNDR